MKCTCHINPDACEAHPCDPRERFVWQPGDVKLVPPKPEVDYVVRDKDGNILEIATKDGRRVYCEPPSREESS